MIEYIINPIDIAKLHVHIFLREDTSALNDHVHDLWDFDPFNGKSNYIKEIEELRNVSTMLRYRDKKIALLNFHNDFDGIRCLANQIIRGISFKVSFDQTIWNKQYEWDKYIAFIFNKKNIDVNLIDNTNSHL
jgi:hypothetical protein